MKKKNYLGFLPKNIANFEAFPQDIFIEHKPWNCYACTFNPLTRYFPYFSSLPGPGGPQGIIPSLGAASFVTPIYDKTPKVTDKAEQENQGLDEFDDLTIEELRSLLDNFKNLSKGEQMDLIRYMKKLEQTDPEKVKLLKGSVKPTPGPSAGDGPSKPTESIRWIL